MDVMKVIKERRSVRAYQNKPIPQEKLKLILEAARFAPSASNRQQWRFIVVQDPKRRESSRKSTFCLPGSSGNCSGSP
jgi:nitroreductase